jgi:hypothetical protein
MGLTGSNEKDTRRSEISRQGGYSESRGRKESSQERYFGNLGGKKHQDGKVAKKGFRVC